MSNRLEATQDTFVEQLARSVQTAGEWCDQVRQAAEHRLGAAYIGDEFAVLEDEQYRRALQVFSLVLDAQLVAQAVTKEVS